MSIEYEATFANIDKYKMRAVLKQSGAQLVRPEFLQKRIVYNLPKGSQLNSGWVRVRDEGDKITLSVKYLDGDRIENQHEIYLVVSSFSEADALVKTLGCEQKSYQETRRELWKLDQVEITTDEWPFLEPIIEIEGHSEAEVKDCAEKLGLNYAEAIFGAIDSVYSRKYGISADRINNHTPEILFNSTNPFL